MKDATLHPVLRALVHGHVLLVMGVVCQLWWIDGLFHLHVDHRLFGVVALATFSAYGAMRLMRMHLPALASNGMMRWYRANARAMYVLVIGAGLAAAFLAWPLCHVILHSLWLPILLAVGYTLPLAMTGGRPVGLRRIPFMKAAIIGFVWACTVVVLPGTVEPDGTLLISDDLWWIAAIWTCFFSAIAIVFDIRDLPHDLPTLCTVPQVLGPAGAKIVSVLLLVPLFTSLLFGVLYSDGGSEAGWQGGKVDLAILLPAIVLVGLGVLIAKAKPERPWWFWDLLMDGSLIALPLLAWLGALFA